MRTKLFACLALICSAASVHAKPADAPTRLFTGRELFGLQYAVRDRAVNSIWGVDVKTGEESAIVPANEDHSSPRWSPDGNKDLRTPVSDAEQYFQALPLRGIPIALVKVPGASHGGLTARPSQSAAKTSAIRAWFERYRAPPAESPATAAVSTE